MQTRGWLISTLAAVAVAAGLLVAWLAFGDGGAEPQRPGPLAGADRAGIPEPADRSADAARPDVGAEQTPPERRALDPVDAARNAAVTGQGVRGRAVDARGAALAGVEAQLFHGGEIGIDLLAAAASIAGGDDDRPNGSAHADAEGRFSIHLGEVSADRRYELRVTAAEHAETVRSGLALEPGRWQDLGTITLARGLVVTGTVREVGGGAAIGGAAVSLYPIRLGHAVQPMPGRRTRWAATTDPNGLFHIDNVPPGRATLSASAPDCARVDRANVEIARDADNRFDFELPAGLTIQGSVVDADGRAIAGARVTGVDPRARHLAVSTSTGADGAFLLDGLHDGKYFVRAEAPGFLRRDAGQIQAGSAGGRIQLDRLGAARLSVVAPDGQAIERFQVQLTTYDAPRKRHGRLPGAHRDVTPDAVDDSDGSFRYPDIQPGRYAFEVLAPGFAKTFSEPFEIAVQADEPRVVVRMRQGGALAGRITDLDGRSLASVEIATLPNDIEDSPLINVFAPMLPVAITRTTTRSADDGGFRLDHLAPGEYQLRLRHADACTSYVKDCAVVEGATEDLGVLRMSPGTILHGIVRVDGRPTGGVKISVTSMPDPSTRGQGRIAVETTSDADGSYALPQRLRPGRYQTRAGRSANLFEQIADFGQTSIEITVEPGEAERQLSFNILSR